MCPCKSSISTIRQKWFEFTWWIDHNLEYAYFLRPRMLYHLRTFFMGICVFSITLMLLRVHHNQHKYMPPILDLEVITEAPMSLHTCSQDIRRDIVKETCRLAKKEGYPIGIRSEDNLKIVVADDERKILYCIMSKTGTKSWLHYLVSLAGKVGPGKWHFRKPDFMERAGLSYRRNVDVDEINTKYKNYFKFIVARHPLQRLASAYYEAILKAGRYAKKDGSAPSFPDFSSRLDDDLFPQLHWSLYQDECQLCKVDYDYIVKTETIEDDSRKINEILRSNVNLTMRHTNFLYEENARMDLFKYDHMFQDIVDTDSEIMKKVLNVYHVDMRTLGYQWDEHEQRSKCENADERGAHCC